MLKTGKYWPLAADDYVAATILLFLSARPPRSYTVPLLLGSYLFMFGNIYAMLFNRLDPVHGSGERIGLLLVLLAAIAVGTISALLQLRLQVKQTGD